MARYGVGTPGLPQAPDTRAWALANAGSVNLVTAAKTFVAGLGATAETKERHVVRPPRAVTDTQYGKCAVRHAVPYDGRTGTDK